MKALLKVCQVVIKVSLYLWIATHQMIRFNQKSALILSKTTKHLWKPLLIIVFPLSVQVSLFLMMLSISVINQVHPSILH